MDCKHGSYSKYGLLYICKSVLQFALRIINDGINEHQ